MEVRGAAHVLFSDWRQKFSKFVSDAVANDPSFRSVVKLNGTLIRPLSGEEGLSSTNQVVQSGGEGLFFPGHNKGSARKSWGFWERLRRVVQLWTGIGRHQQRLHYCIVTFSREAFIYCQSWEKKTRNVLTFPVDLCVRLIESEFLLCVSLVHLRKAFKFLLHQ